jgi:hypothetical protein
MENEIMMVFPVERCGSSRPGVGLVGLVQDGDDGVGDEPADCAAGTPAECMEIADFFWAQ